MKLIFKRLHKAAKIPSYQSDKSSGFDLTASETVVIHSLETGIVHTGLAVQLPLNTELQLRPRSSLLVKFPGYLSACAVEEDYTGEIVLIVYNRLFNKDLHVKTGDKIAYAVVSPVIRCEIEEGEMGERYNMHDMEEVDTKDGKGRI